MRNKLNYSAVKKRRRTHALVIGELNKLILIFEYLPGRYLYNRSSSSIYTIGNPIIPARRLKKSMLNPVGKPQRARIRIRNR